MGLPLSPRTASDMNIASNSPRVSSPLKSVTPQKVSDDSFLDSANSSPFQTDVGTNIGQENLPSTMANLSPSKKSPARTKTPDFQNFDENTATNPILPPSNLSSNVFTNSTSLNTGSSPSKVPLPPSSPFKEIPDDTLRVSPKHVAIEGSTDMEDLDTKSVASDDTGFTAFSAVPDMTLFAKLGNRTPGRSARSPRKAENTPSSHVFMTPATSRRQHAASSRAASPTPRARPGKDGDTTTLLLDFTQPLDGGFRQSHSPTKSNTEPNLLQHIHSQRVPSPTKASRTPGRKAMLNLLDFDLPPQPTPRSIPTITVRELESLKSQYLSEISSLKASLSGREAEVVSLKKAVGDAERRVGDAQESLRDERSAREHAEDLKNEWEKKGKEVESALRKFKEEFMAEEKEKEDLVQKLDEANQARQEAELKAAEATRNACVAQSDFDGRSSNPAATDAIVAQKVAAQLDEKMENLARELHQVYKKKHETKVASLKKNYEVRAEKKCAELQAKVEELARQNDELHAIKELSLSIELPRATKEANVSEDSQRLIEEQRTRLQQCEATMAGLREEMSSIQQGQSELLQDLERERVEKGELVAAVDEMLALQAEAPPGTPQRTAIVEDFRRSIGGPGSRAGSTVGMSSLQAPSGSESFGFGSSVGRRGPALPQRSISGGSKSAMRSNIERMGGTAR